jgi:MFS superfamily sulfate permease-like transporter
LKKFVKINIKGTYAIVSLMVVSALNKYDGVLYPKYSAEPDNQNTTLIDSLISGNSTSDVYQHAILRHSAEGGGGSVISDHANFISENPVEARVMIAGSMALLVGLLHCLFAILHVGVVTKYLSDSIVNGFTIGAAYHVVTSQISTLLGIKLDGEEIPFVLIGVSFRID